MEKMLEVGHCLGCRGGGGKLVQVRGKFGRRYLQHVECARWYAEQARVRVHVAGVVKVTRRAK